MPNIYILLMILLAIWVWMLADCATNETDANNDRLIWVLIIIFTNFIGAMLYLTIRRPMRKAKLGK